MNFKISKHLVYLPLLILTIFFLMNKKFEVFDVLVSTILIYIINFCFEKYEKTIEPFKANEDISGLYSINTENTDGKFHESSKLSTILNDDYDSNNMKILDDNFIFKNKPVSEGNLFSTTLKPDIGKLENNFDKISFFAKNGFYNKHSIDKNGNIKDTFGNIVAQSDNLKGNDDKMIDNYGNIVDIDGNIITEIGNSENIKQFIIQMGKDGRLDNYKIDQNGNIIDGNNNLLANIPEFKIYENSKINKFGFSILDNNVLGHIGGPQEGLNILIEKSREGKLNNHHIKNDGTIFDDKVSVGKVDILKKYDGNKIDNQGYIIDINENKIGYIGGEKRAFEFLLLAAKNGELNDNVIDNNGNILDRNNVKVGQLDSLKQYANGIIDDIGFILDNNGNVLGHIGGVEESYKLILDKAKNGDLEGFKINVDGNILDKNLKIVATFDSLKGYPVLNVIDKYGNILNETRQHIGYIGGEIEAEKLLIKLLDEGLIDKFMIKKNGLVHDKKDNFVTRLNQYKVLHGSTIDRYGNILNKDNEIFNHIDQTNGITNILIKMLNNNLLKDFVINNEGKIFDTENNTLTKYDFLSKLSSEFIIDKNGNIVFNSNIIENLKKLVVLNQLVTNIKNNKGDVYNIENNNILNKDNINVVTVKELEKFPSANKIGLNGDIMSSLDNKVLTNLKDVFDIVINNIIVKINTIKEKLIYRDRIKYNNKNINLDNLNKFTYGYSYLHTDYWNLPTERKPVCENVKPCRVCPKQTSGVKNNLMKWN